ncbi:hypothetical protein CL622_05020 [archaeon]|nr:hypothetical protein [archaeon]
MCAEEKLRKLAGLQTLETATKALGFTRQATLNTLSKLKKEGYVTVKGGGKQKRLYRITLRKQRKRSPGMYDILNKYSPMKLAIWTDHQVHGPYGPEDALIDAIKTKKFRPILASLRLFNHIKDWKKVYRLAKENDCWQQVGALYEVARIYFRVKKMPSYYTVPTTNKWKKLTQLKRKNFPHIAKKWHVYIPFNEHDLKEIK